MPLNDSTNLSGYIQLPQAQGPVAPSPSTDLQPGRSSTMRCPLPILGAASADALRSYYLKGNVPQIRLLSPQSSVPTSSVGSTTGGVVSSSGGSSTPSNIVSKQSSITTAVIPPNNKFTGVISISRSFQLLVVTANKAARVELYGTNQAQISDLSRGLDVPPAAGTAQNIICDVVLDTSPFSWTFQNRTGANADAPQNTQVYITVTNLDTLSDAITVTVQYVPLET